MKKKIKSFFAAIGYLFMVFSLQLVVSIVGGIIFGFVYIMKNSSEISTNGLNIEGLMNKSMEMSSYILLFSSIVTILVFLLIYKIRKRNFKEELQIVKTIKVNIIISIILGISAWLFNTGLLVLIKELGLFTEHFIIMEKIISPLTNGNIVVSLLTVGIVAPFTEEFIFRGVIFKTLNKNISILWTIIIQAIFFGLFHGNLIQGTYATFLGLVFGYITYRTKSLWPAIVMHIINNCMSTISPFILSNVPSTIGVLMIFIIIGVLGLIISLYFINKKNISNKIIY